MLNFSAKICQKKEKYVELGAIFNTKCGFGKNWYKNMGKEKLHKIINHALLENFTKWQEAERNRWKYRKEKFY